MSEKATATEEVKAAPSDNLSVEALGAMINKGRKKAAPASAPVEEETPAETLSEHAETAGEEIKPTETETVEEVTAATEETEETAKPEGESDEDKAGAEEEAKQPKSKAVKELRDRVHKVVDQRDAERNQRLDLQRQLDETRAQLTAAQQGGNKPTPAMQANEQFADDPAVVEIDRTLGDVEAFLDFAERHPDGGSFEDGGKTYELDADQMKAFRTKSEKERIRLSSKREARLESARQVFQGKRAAAHTEAVKLYPWIERKESSEFQEAIKLIRANPGVMNHADFELIVARQIAGQRLETEARKKLGTGNGATKPPGTRTPPPVVTHTPSAAPKVNGKPVKPISETAFGKTGRVDDLGKLLAERRQARMQPAAER